LAAVISLMVLFLIVCIIMERRNGLTRSMQFLWQSAEQAQQATTQLYANGEQNLALAKHAETWDWKEAVSAQVGKRAGA
jgi:hypothetical protein